MQSNAATLCHVGLVERTPAVRQGITELADGLRLWLMHSSHNRSGEIASNSTDGL